MHWAARLDRGVVAVLNALAWRWPLARVAVAWGARWLSSVEVGLMVALGLSGRPRGAVRVFGSVGIVYALAFAIGRLLPRERPFVAVSVVKPLVLHGERRSFPSRHVASAVAMACVAQPARPGLARLMRLVAGLLALTRVAAGMHYPSDVLGGALLGWLVGMALRHR
jgi:membrane-associated phospholipid phosphatase